MVTHYLEYSKGWVFVFSISLLRIFQRTYFIYLLFFNMYLLNRHEFEQTLGDGEGQGSLACCNPWGHKELDMTEWLKNNMYLFYLFYSFGCGTQDLWSLHYVTGSLVAACKTVFRCSMQTLSCGTWNSSSLTGDWTPAPCIGNTESYQGSPNMFFF